VLFYLLGSYIVSVRALCFRRRVRRLSVRLSCVKYRKQSETGAKFCCLYGKYGSPSTNVTSNFAPDVAKHPQK